jgi:hypothetical protein
MPIASTGPCLAKGGLSSPNNTRFDYPRLSGGAVDSPSAGLFRLVTPALALVLAMVVLGLLAGDRPYSWTDFVSTVTESTRSQPSAVGADSRVFDRDGASRANDDGYLEGLAKALDYHS